MNHAAHGKPGCLFWSWPLAKATVRARRACHWPAAADLKKDWISCGPRFCPLSWRQFSTAQHDLAVVSPGPALASVSDSCRCPTRPTELCGTRRRLEPSPWPPSQPLLCPVWPFRRISPLPDGHCSAPESSVRGCLPLSPLPSPASASTCRPWMIYGIRYCAQCPRRRRHTPGRGIDKWRARLWRTSTACVPALAAERSSARIGCAKDVSRT